MEKRRGKPITRRLREMMIDTQKPWRFGLDLASGCRDWVRVPHRLPVNHLRAKENWIVGVASGLLHKAPPQAVEDKNPGTGDHFHPGPLA